MRRPASLILVIPVFIVLCLLYITVYPVFVFSNKFSFRRRMLV